jgi:hypothetical protein
MTSLLFRKADGSFCHASGGDVRRFVAGDSAAFVRPREHRKGPHDSGTMRQPNRSVGDLSVG